MLDLETEKLTSKLYIETDFSYTSDRFCGPGFFACGDAACFIDPLLSSGVHLAMMSQLTVAASVHSILTNEISGTRALNYFEMTYRKYYTRYLILASAFYDLIKGRSGYFEQAQDLATQDPSL